MLSFLLAVLLAYTAAPVAALLIQKLEGTFPDLLVDLSFAAPRHIGSGILRWRVDEGNWSLWPARGSQFFAPASRATSLRFTKAAFGDSCLRSGSHSLSFQFQPLPDDGDRPIVTRTFSLPRDYHCGAPPRLRRVPKLAEILFTLINSGGAFPDLTMNWKAVVTDGYSGVLRWRVDEDPWVTVWNGNSEYIVNQTMEGTVSLNDWALKDHCLRTGEHQLDLQVQSDTNGNSPTVSQTFNVNWDYGCGPAGGLILVNSSGTFPAIEVDYVAIVTQPYSAPMYWRVDNGKWIAVPELVITETTITSYIRWGDTYWIEAGLIPAGSHVLGLQLKSPTLGDSNIIVCPFTVDGDYPRATPTVPGFAQSNLLMYIAIGVGVLALIVIGYVCYKRQTEKDSDEDAPIHATSILADA